MSNSLERMGEDIRVQGGQGTGRMTDLIFNEETGEWVTKPQGSEISDNETIVTDMTKTGFARS